MVTTKGDAVTVSPVSLSVQDVLKASANSSSTDLFEEAHKTVLKLVNTTFSLKQNLPDHQMSTMKK